MSALYPEVGCYRQIQKMTKDIGYILTVIIGISGLLHLIGIFNNGEANLYIGLKLTGAATLSLGLNYFANGMSFEQETF
jgi:hypothetical protein